jgi:hypothetical protein
MLNARTAVYAHALIYNGVHKSLVVFLKGNAFFGANLFARSTTAAVIAEYAYIVHIIPRLFS